MAPTATTSTGSGTPTAMPIDNQPTLSSGFAGEEFINNLGSDLAPLLTLFGEQVTKQFLSMSLGWADHILLAVGPLGIITTVVSAIRVSNVRVLKAVIGRAREKLATAELELLSSTSDATSELWSEEGIVRQPGHAKILELVAYRSKATEQETDTQGIKLEDSNSEIHIGDLGDVCKIKVFKDASEGRSTFLGDVLRKLGLKSPRPPRIPPDQLAKQPPNLTLNLHGALPKSRDLWAFAVIGIALQLVAVVIPALMTYYWKILKGKTHVQDYAYPTFLTGTCLLVVGIAVCSYFIEATTVEQTFKPTGRHKVKTIFRLQMECTMGDQPFKTYVIVNDPKDDWIRTSRYDPSDNEAAIQDAANGPERTATLSSRLRKKAQKPMVIVAVMLCLTGFICQFVGLRALHWSGTVIQLGVTLIMTCIRAWARVGISRKPVTFHIPISDPNSLAMSLGTVCRDEWPPDGEPWPETPSLFTPYRYKHNKEGWNNRRFNPGLITTNDPRIVLRQKLQSLSPQTDADLIPRADDLFDAIQVIISVFFLPGTFGDITWAHVIEIGYFLDDPCYARLELNVRTETDFSRSEFPKYLDRATLHALLAFWRYLYHGIFSRRCVAKVFSREDWMAKKDFLLAHTESDVARLVLSINGSLHLTDGESLLWSHGDVFTGLSIENMQLSTASSAVDENPSYGYLVTNEKNDFIEHEFELFTGVLDAMWLKVYVGYDYETKTWWYRRFRGSRQIVQVDSIVRIIMQRRLCETEKDAKLLVVSSLARCTVWKDPPRQAVPASTSDSPTPSAPATANVSGHQPTPTPSTPRSSASATTESEDGAPTVVLSEAAENQA